MGRDRAFELVFQEYNRMIAAYLYGITGDSERALDLTQEVFLIAYRRMDEFDSSRSLAAWLRGIARNVARNYIRKHRSHRQILLEGNELEEVFAAFDDVRNEDAWEKRLDVLDRCLGRLPDRQRDVVDRRYFKGEDVADIAALLPTS